MGSSNKELRTSQVRPPQPPKPTPEPPRVTTTVVIEHIEEDTVPEGPELSHSRDMLREHILGKHPNLILFHTTGRYRLKKPPGWDGFINRPASQTLTQITEVDVKGKFMWWKLSDDDEKWYLFTTYGMTGRWSLKEDPDHVTASMTFHDGESIHFNDVRNFGTLKLVRGRAALEAKLRTLGPDMLNDRPTGEEFVAQLRKKDDWNICRVLMDQSVVSGVGNYVKCEALYRAGIDPRVTVSDLDDARLGILCMHITSVMVESYESRGASFNTYRNPDESRGTASFGFRCYQREQDPNGNPVERLKTDDGRTTHWVPAIQSRDMSPDV